MIILAVCIVIMIVIILCFVLMCRFVRASKNENDLIEQEKWLKQFNQQKREKERRKLHGR